MVSFRLKPIFATVPVVSKIATHIKSCQMRSNDSYHTSLFKVQSKSLIHPVLTSFRLLLRMEDPFVLIRWSCKCLHLMDGSYSISPPPPFVDLRNWLFWGINPPLIQLIKKILTYIICWSRHCKIQHICLRAKLVLNYLPVYYFKQVQNKLFTLPNELSLYKSKHKPSLLLF